MKVHKLEFSRAQEQKTKTYDHALVDLLKKRAADGWRLDAIDGENVLALCEYCWKPITSKTPYVADAEGICVCKKCFGGK